MGFYVEIETANPEDETRNSNIGPFRSQEAAQTFANSLGKAAGLTQPNPDISGYWVGFGEYDDGGITMNVSVTVMVRMLYAPRVRPHVKNIKAFLRGEG